MEILDAVDVPTGIHGEGNPIQAAMAHDTGEAVGMVGLPGGSEDPFHDGLRAYTALLQCVNIAGFTVGFLLYCVERLPPQLVVAHHAGEALHVEDLVHGCAASAFPNNILPTASTAAKVVIRGRILHVIQHFLCQMFQLIFRPEGRSA